MMWWLVLAIVALLILLVLVFPLGAEAASNTGRLRFYAILAGLHIPMPEWVVDRVKARMKRKKSGKKENDKEEDRKADLDKKSDGIPEKESLFVRLFGLDDLRTTLKLIVRLLRTLRIRVHRLHVLVSSPNPALTGMVYGWACGLIGALPSDWPVSVEADWNSPKPEFTFRVEVSVIPIRVIGALLGFLLKRYMPKFV